MINLKHGPAIMAIVREGSITAASKKLFVSQPALSQTIKQVEEELGAPIFRRDVHHIELTHAGKLYVDAVQEMLTIDRNLHTRVEDSKGEVFGEFTLGISTQRGLQLLPQVLPEFIRKYPHVKMNVTQSTMAELITQLENHELDFVLAFRPTVANPKIESRVLFHHRLAAIVNENHALASRNSITLEELQRYDLALTRRGTQARSAFRHAIADHDYQYKIKVEMNTVYLLFRLVRESNYVTILSESTVVGEHGLKAIPIVDTDIPEKEMQGCIHMLKNAYVKNSTKEFVKMLVESTSVLRMDIIQDNR